jgi:competence protein ComFB
MTAIVLLNMVEENVVEAYSNLGDHFPNFCGCDTCRADVLVFALNRLPARYVATTEGKVVTEFNLDKDQMRATIDVTMMDAFRKVAAAPRCGNTKPQLL